MQVFITLTRNNPHFLFQLDILVEDTLVSTFTRQVGQAPIMVQSELCNLHGLCPEELIKKKEDHNEMGGYFVINGNEKVVRFVWSPTAFIFSLTAIWDKNESQRPLLRCFLLNIDPESDSEIFFVRC